MLHSHRAVLWAASSLGIAIILAAILSSRQAPRLNIIAADSPTTVAEARQ
jgi:hypothetical protein